jgi:hypothetical protein
MQHQLEPRGSGIPTVPAAGSLESQALGQAAQILAEVGQRGNLSGLGAWATKTELVLATGKSRDWLERQDRAGRLPSRVEMVPGHRRLRTVYDVAMVQQLLLEAGR